MPEPNGAIVTCNECGLTRFDHEVCACGEIKPVHIAINVNRDNEQEFIGVFSTKDLALSAISRYRSEPLDFANDGSSCVDRFDGDGIRDCCAFIIPTNIDATPDKR
jgi:hypothetical protein